MFRRQTYSSAWNSNFCSLNHIGCSKFAALRNRKSSSELSSSSSLFCSFYQCSLRHRSTGAPTSRDKQRNQPNADPTTGNQMAITESPDMTPHLQFGLNVLENVSLPTGTIPKTDMEKENAMRAKFGPDGPGERPSKSSQQIRRDMLMEQQDVDGLPWEVRWKKSLIPTSEEVIQDIRDRFDLYIQDPIEREQEWYLHWKDRSFKVQKDRMIWPQGYTDYLDHYDENGRRRVLPTDQRWSDSSWKHLADTHYRDRMWLIEGEERKAVHDSLKAESQLMEEESQRQLEIGDVFHGISSGVVDLDPEQTFQALSGSADPLEVAKTKLKIQAYGAGQALKGNDRSHHTSSSPHEAVTALGQELLPSGVTVEQGSILAAEAAIAHEALEQQSEAARVAGRDPTLTMMKSELGEAKKRQDQPMLRTLVERGIQAIKENTSTLQEVEDSSPKSSLLAGTSEAKNVDHEEKADPSGNAEGFIRVEPRPKDKEPDIPPELCHPPTSRELEEMPEWYRQTLVETGPMIRSYGLTKDPLEVQQVESGFPREGTSLEKKDNDYTLETQKENTDHDDFRSTKEEKEKKHRNLSHEPSRPSSAAPQEWYSPPPPEAEEDRVTNDDAIDGVSSFDEYKLHKLRTLPELVVGYKPLPLYREVQAQQQQEQEKNGQGNVSTAEEGEGANLPKSRKLRKERQERLRAAKLHYDSDILLPNLPWESDSIVDPYRGVAENETVPFHKSDLERTWRAYRESFQQAITEFGNLTQVATEANSEKMLFDTMTRFREGKVGDHPPIPEEQEEVFRLVFEAHTKHFLADFYKFKGNRVTEANTTKAQADEMLRKASAKSKLLGKKFMDFLQEMTSLELESIRKNPVQRYCILVRDKKYEPIASPFMKWIKNELSEFNVKEFQSAEQLDTHREFLARHCNDARAKVPQRLEGISDAARDAAVEAFYHWCRGALCYYAGKHFHRMFIDYADTRLRSRAEELFEDSYEYFSNYAKAAKNIIQIPVPDSDPPYEYDEKEFLDGESAIFAEISGHLDKAEAIWHSGSTKRWYPMTDETEYMWFNERRGRLTLAMDISDRCLENVNKKTHPSIHPFPERAKIFLEGAPLTQETAEHLWLRYMGDLYWEHSEFMYRQGYFRTGLSYRNKCLNLYHLAIRTAKERLPPTWKAPLLTEAKYLLRVYEPGQDVTRHLKEVETVVSKLFSFKEPAHWIEPFSELPFRLAVVHANLPAYGEAITREVQRRVHQRPSQELLMKNMLQRANGGATLPELEEYFKVADAVSDELFRNKILKWRSKEHEGSDPYFFWTHLYFAFRVLPKNREEVEKMWGMYKPAYSYIYTQSALACRQRGYRLINDALRRVCQILLCGERDQKQILFDELKKVRDLMSHVVDRKELDRAITALELHMQNPQRLPYIYGTGLLLKEAQNQEKIARNPLLRSALGEEEYLKLRERQQDLRESGLSLNPQQAAQLQSNDRQPTEDTSDVSLPGAEAPPLQTRQAFQ